MQVSECPRCGAPARLQDRRCEFCKAPFVVDSLAAVTGFDKQTIDKYVSAYRKNLSNDNGEAAFGLGLCYLQLKLYMQATKPFEKAIELMPERPAVYYYYSLALLRGRKPRQLTLDEVRAIEGYLDAAIQLDSSGSQYYYLLAAVKHDYYVRNGLRLNPPTVEHLLSQAASGVVETTEMQRMLEYLPIEDGPVLHFMRA